MILRAQLKLWWQFGLGVDHREISVLQFQSDFFNLLVMDTIFSEQPVLVERGKGLELDHLEGPFPNELFHNSMIL